MTLQIRSIEEYHSAYQRAVDHPEAFWAEQAETFQWHKPWSKVLDWNFEGPDINWFVGGKLNITENCLDRHLATRGDQVAILWEANDPEAPNRSFTYRQLHAEVCKAANALKANGIQKGDRVCFYMPMVPEL
nr:acetyl-coenzyme A synthetase N-terminal domain-containing protein [Haliscomenobacter sp.]